MSFYIEALIVFVTSLAVGLLWLRQLFEAVHSTALPF
jgi:hypothetical protein